MSEENKRNSDDINAKTSITIKNKKMANVLMTKLNKNKNEFSVEDFLKLKTLVIDCDMSEKDNIFVDYDVLKYSKELKELVLANMDVQDFMLEDLSKIEPLERIIFDNCYFVSEEPFKDLKVKKIELLNTQLDDFLILEDMQNLKEVVLTTNIFNANQDNIKKLEGKNIIVKEYDAF